MDKAIVRSVLNPLKELNMSKLNTLFVATALLFAAGAQADTAAQVAQERTALAMRTAGVDHLMPELRDANASGLAQSRQSAAQTAAAQPAKTRAQVLAELQQARQNGEMDFAAAQVGFPTQPAAVASSDTRLAAAPAKTLR